MPIPKFSIWPCFNLKSNFQFSINSKFLNFENSIKISNLKFKFRPGRGFTLIEVLVAITIIGIMVGSTAVVYDVGRKKGRDTKRKQDLTQISAALELYRQDNGVYPPASPGTSFDSAAGGDWIPDLVPGYIQKLPLDPKQTAVNVLNRLAGVTKGVFGGGGKKISTGEVASAHIQSVIIRPNGIGSFTDWQSQYPSTGSHWSKTTSNDGDSSYVRYIGWNSGGGGRKIEAYNLQNPVFTGAINSVNLYFRTRQETAGGPTFGFGLRLGANVTRTTRVLSNTTYQQTSFTNISRPGGGAWTISDLNSIEAFIDVDANENVRLTEIYVQVDYTRPPTAATSAANPIDITTATLNGSANPNGQATTGWFRYSTTNPGTCNDTFGTRVPASGGAALGSGTSVVPYSQGIGSLASNTTYYFCAIANNASGNGYGSVLSFMTASLPPPAVTFTSQPSTMPVAPGTVVILSWTSSGADSCSGIVGPADWLGAKALNGSQNETVSTNTTFTLRCSNAGGNTDQTINIIVYVAPPVVTIMGIYRYDVLPDRKSYTIWTDLENDDDPQRNSGANATCTDTTPSGTTYDYCLKPSF